MQCLFSFSKVLKKKIENEIFEFCKNFGLVYATQLHANWTACCKDQFRSKFFRGCLTSRVFADLGCSWPSFKGWAEHGRATK